MLLYILGMPLANILPTIMSLDVSISVIVGNFARGSVPRTTSSLQRINRVNVPLAVPFDPPP